MEAKGKTSLCASIAEVLEFLNSLFISGVGYSAISTARAALASIVTFTDSPLTINNHPLVSRFVKGVFQTRPSLPRYSITWDVSVVLRYLKGLQPLEDMSFKLLSYKLLMLILLTTGNRGQSVHLMRMDAMSKTHNSYTFIIPDLLKQSKPGQACHSIQLRAYEPDRQLCVVLCMDEYLRRTSPLRPADVNSLFISYVKPHQSISRSTISRWVKDTMSAAGIDTSAFKPHSTRAASSSAALARATPLQTILSTAGWKSQCTFAKFYNKNIVPLNTYGDNVLSSMP